MADLAKQQKPRSSALLARAQQAYRDQLAAQAARPKPAARRNEAAATVPSPPASSPSPPAVPVRVDPPAPPAGTNPHHNDPFLVCTRAARERRRLRRGEPRRLLRRVPVLATDLGCHREPRRPPAAHRRASGSGVGLGPGPAGVGAVPVAGQRALAAVSVTRAPRDCAATSAANSELAASARARSLPRLAAVTTPWGRARRAESAAACDVDVASASIAPVTGITRLENEASREHGIGREHEVDELAGLVDVLARRSARPCWSTRADRPRSARRT